ncbi:MAG: hypothetical protein HY901_31135, partial [Deltaproteobacteria bacterium]|nr:hypothetical protein [Deltaproteobacteria bacterium]
MHDERDPDAARLKVARDVVQGFLVKKKRTARLLFVATLASECVFLA